MGIQGLLPCLKDITVHTNLSEFAGEKIGVDTYVWLHRSAYVSSYELVTNQPTRRWIDYCINRLKLLLHHKIIPILIFDGKNLPAKDATNAKRFKIRETYKRKGFALLDKNRTAAMEAFQKAVDVTPSMAARFIQEIRDQELDVECIVAPYEADAQLAFMMKKGLIDAVVTEDSDLLTFGCTRVLFKLDNAGNCDFVDLSRLQELSMCKGVTQDMFRWACILAGCDYLPSIPGFGVKTGLKVVAAYRELKRIFRYLKMEKAGDIPEDYLEGFAKAEQTFLHQRVFDPETQTVIPLTPFEPGIDERMMDFVGHTIEPEIAQKIARGRIDPNTLLPFEFAHQPRRSIASVRTRYTPTRSRLPDLKLSKNTIRSYFTVNSSNTNAGFKPPRKKQSPPPKKMNALEAFVLSSNPLKPSSEMLEVDETPINDDPDLRYCESETSTPSPQFFPKKDNNRDVLAPESPSGNLKERQMHTRQRTTVRSRFFGSKTAASPAVRSLSFDPDSKKRPRDAACESSVVSINKMFGGKRLSIKPHIDNENIHNGQRLQSVTHQVPQACKGTQSRKRQKFALFQP